MVPLLLLIGSHSFLAAHVANRKENLREERLPGYLRYTNVALLCPAGCDGTLRDYLLHDGADARIIENRNDWQELPRYWHPDILIACEWSDPVKDLLSEILPSDSFGKPIPVVLLGTTDLHLIVSALESGMVDACLEERATPAVIAAQCKSLLKKNGKQSKIINKPPYLYINPSTCRLRIQNQEVHWPQGVLLLFHLLASKKGDAITLQELSVFLGGRQHRSNTVVVRMRRLRKHLEEAGVDSWLETVRGVGYRLTIPTHSH